MVWPVHMGSVGGVRLLNGLIAAAIGVFTTLMSDLIPELNCEAHLNFGKCAI